MELKIINVSDILANFYQPRTKFDKEKIKELSESILSNGLINPITITPDKKRKGKYMIVSGERRWQSHRASKIKTIPCFIKEYSTDGQFMVESLIENVHREDLTPLEKGKFCQKIMKEEGIKTYTELKSKINVSSAVIGDWMDEIKIRKQIKGPLNVSSSVIRETQALPEKQRIKLIKQASDEDFGSRKMREIVKEKKIIAEYGEEKDEESKKGYEGVTLNIFLNKEEKKATVKACQKEKLQMEILVKKNHLAWLKKKKYL